MNIERALDVTGWMSEPELTYLAEAASKSQPPYWDGLLKAVHELVPRFRVVPNTTIWTTEGL